MYKRICAHRKNVVHIQKQNFGYIQQKVRTQSKLCVYMVHTHRERERERERERDVREDAMKCV